MNSLNFDLVIFGAGLAGLGLAKQVLARRPSSRVCIIEKGVFPRPDAIAKVGESTVEIGSHYLTHRLNIGKYLESQHIQKFGLRLFTGVAENIEELDEIGVSQVFGLATYQIDRGPLENHLYQEVCNLGGVILEAHTVEEIHLNAGGSHQLSTKKCDGETVQIESSWLVDASGRAGLIKKHLSLGQSSPHQANAVWFRVNQSIKVDQWSDDHQWQQRCTPMHERWRSTNHLTGPGYWVWVIPLSCGATSIGIVMDNDVFNSANFSRSEQTLEWLSVNQPALSTQLMHAQLLDYVVLEDYSYDCRQTFSEDRWAITGEAGRFADPFYSPGTDFIAFANDFISDLFCSEQDNEDIRLRARLYDSVLRDIYKNTLSLYVDQYGGFGDRILMGVKILWDYSYYWGVLCLMYFDDQLANINTLKQHAAVLRESQRLNLSVQECFRERAALRIQQSPSGLFVDQYSIPCLLKFNDILKSNDQDRTDTHLAENIEILAHISVFVRDMLSDNPLRVISAHEQSLLGDYRYALMPELTIDLSAPSD